MPRVELRGRDGAPLGRELVLPADVAGRPLRAFLASPEAFGSAGVTEKPRTVPGPAERRGGPGTSPFCEGNL